MEMVRVWESGGVIVVVVLRSFVVVFVLEESNPVGTFQGFFS